ncbi:hypothetical protein vseg_013619 [Gypsophila vaccaria]
MFIVVIANQTPITYHLLPQHPSPHLMPPFSPVADPTQPWSPPPSLIFLFSSQVLPPSIPTTLHSLRPLPCHSPTEIQTLITLILPDPKHPPQLPRFAIDHSSQRRLPKPVLLTIVALPNS